MKISRPAAGNSPNTRFGRRSAGRARVCRSVSRGASVFEADVPLRIERLRRLVECLRRNAAIAHRFFQKIRLLFCVFKMQYHGAVFALKIEQVQVEKIVVVAAEPYPVVARIGQTVFFIKQFVFVLERRGSCFRGNPGARTHIFGSGQVPFRAFYPGRNWCC